LKCSQTQDEVITERGTKLLPFPPPSQIQISVTRDNRVQEEFEGRVRIFLDQNPNTSINAMKNVREILS
jgi:hypothetical protein